MLLETVTPQVVNPQTGRKEIVYFDVPAFSFDKRLDKWVFNVVTFYIDKDQSGKEHAVLINESVALFKRATFKKLYPDLNMNDLVESPNLMAKMLIEQIDFINKFKGKASYEYARFWDLTQKDLIDKHYAAE